MPTETESVICTRIILRRESSLHLFTSCCRSVFLLVLDLLIVLKNCIPTGAAASSLLPVRYCNALLPEARAIGCCGGELVNADADDEARCKRSNARPIAHADRAAAAG